MNFRAPTPRTLAALLILLTVAAYLPAIGAGYIWDDDTLLTANPQMRSVAGLGQIWRGEQSRDYTPLTLTVFWLEHRLWGDTPTGFHVVNILLHALSAVLLWRILLRLRIPGAWVGALLFAIHPVNVASVAWIAELKNTLSGALFFGSVLCYLAGIFFGALALFFLAALSKGAVVTLPAALVLCVLWRDRKFGWRDFWRIAPFAVIAAGAALLTIRYQGRAPHYGLLPDSIQYRIARAGADIWLYLGALFWPAGMSPMRAPWLPDLRSALTYLPALAAVAAPVVFWWQRRGWGRPLLFAYAYYVIMLLPVLGFVWMALMQETPGADWWQYMAAPGILACVAGCVAAHESHVSHISHGRYARYGSYVAVVALLMCQTWRRAAVYQSMESYCRAVTAEDRHAWTLENNLGIMLKRQGRLAEAEACYQQALRDNPRYPDAHVNLSNLGGVLAGQRRFAEAEQCFREVAALEPENILIRIRLCQALVAQGKKEAALAICAEVDRIAGKSGDAVAIAAAARLRHDCEAAR